jgi:hypothetical protein
MLLTLVVRDRDAFPFALEEARLAHNTVRPVDHERLFPSELEFGTDGRIVHHLGELVSRLKFENIDGTDIPAVSTTGALLHLHNDFDHGRVPARTKQRGDLHPAPAENRV